jgi:hypothetical protein
VSMRLEHPVDLPADLPARRIFRIVLPGIMGDRSFRGLL